MRVKLTWPEKSNQGSKYRNRDFLNRGVEIQLLIFAPFPISTSNLKTKINSIWRISIQTWIFQVIDFECLNSHYMLLLGPFEVPEMAAWLGSGSISFSRYFFIGPVKLENCKELSTMFFLKSVWNDVPSANKKTTTHTWLAKFFEGKGGTFFFFKWSQIYEKRF